MADNPADSSGVNRPGNTKIESTYAQVGRYPKKRGENKQGKRTLKAEAYAEAGVGRAQIKRRIFKSEAKGPNASARAKASPLSLSASVGAELASASAAVKIGPCVASADISADAAGLLDVIDYYDRPSKASAEATYARSRTYAVGFENKPGMRVPKAGAYAEAGVGKARAEFSVFEAEAKGPNASAAASANPLGVSAIARAELASASAAAGPLKVKAGLAVDTGVSVGPEGLEIKVLGTGFTIGKKTSVSLLGNEVGCCLL